MSMQQCSECGEFYDTDKYPEDICERCFDKSDIENIVLKQEET